MAPARVPGPRARVRSLGLVAYTPSEWTDLFVAAAGASAALAGLVFVAVSINIERILHFEGLPERALATMLLFVSVLIVSIIGLIPGQSHTALGAELLGVSLVFTAVIVTQVVRGLPTGHSSWVVSRLAVIALGTLPIVVGAISLLALEGGGLYWIVGGMLGATIGAVANAWVLLVEILR